MAKADVKEPEAVEVEPSVYDKLVLEVERLSKLVETKSDEFGVKVKRLEAAVFGAHSVV